MTSRCANKRSFSAISFSWSKVLAWSILDERMSLNLSICSRYAAFASVLREAYYYIIMQSYIYI
jgi:hypothetical protein